MTSSTPPSADLARSNTRNLRVKTGRQKEGQPGHKGHTLTFSNVVNETITPPSETICKEYGTSLKNTQTYIKSRKQVHDIPPVIINVTEHQKIACDCPNCGRTHEGEFPKEIKGNVQYGKNLNAIVAYLSTYHYLPISRLSRLLSDLLDAKISQGTIVNILKDMATKAEITLYEEIKREIANANCIGADETGIKINGERGWFFVFQTPTATFIKSSLKRDFDTIEQTYSGGFPESIYVTDCLPAQLKVNAKGHQLCIAHLLRETENFIQL